MIDGGSSGPEKTVRPHGFSEHARPHRSEKTMHSQGGDHQKTGDQSKANQPSVLWKLHHRFESHDTRMPLESDSGKDEHMQQMPEKQSKYKDKVSQKLKEQEFYLKIL